MGCRGLQQEANPEIETSTPNLTKETLAIKLQVKIDQSNNSSK